jgi:hypothetical protein
MPAPSPVVLQRWWGARIALPRLHSPGARDLTKLTLESIVIVYTSPFKAIDWTLRWRGHVMVIEPAYALELVGSSLDAQNTILGYAPELAEAARPV